MTQADIEIIAAIRKNLGRKALRSWVKETYGLTTYKARSLIGCAKAQDQSGSGVPFTFPALEPGDPLLRAAVVRELKKPTSAEAIARNLKTTPEVITGVIADLEAHGYIIKHTGRRIQSNGFVQEGSTRIARENHYIGKPLSFGVVSDMHMCSNHERLDVLNEAYDTFAERGIHTVLCPGNYVDGEARFNTHELKVHGIADQCRYAIDHWPERKGITTYYIDGDDHEGWYQQRDGIEFGRYLELEAKDSGRTDLYYMGYMEADFELKAPEGSAVIKILHAGGGSAYATSYTSQKLAECVPMESEILTPTGWKRYESLSVGDLVLGYNIATGVNEWTTLLGLNRYDDQTVCTYKNDSFQVTCTPDHKWAMEWEKRGSRYKEQTYVYPSERHLWTIGEAKDRSRIVQAAPSPSGAGVSFYNHEDILNRADAVQVVLNMTSAQRQAFIFGFMVGEGTKVQNKGVPTGTLLASQNPGPVHDAFVLACNLEGRAVSVHPSFKMTDKGRRQCNKLTILHKNRRMVNSIRVVKEFRCNVWCPTTALGTWVMRQGDVVTITGNSFQGGEKPAVAIIGHYHKFDYCFPRAVHCIQAGCCQDQTRFMRKKKLAAHLGFCIITLQQDTCGSITRFVPEFFPFWDRGYYIRRDVKL